MKSKAIKVRKGSDPEWIQDIACYFFTSQKKGKSDGYKKELLDLFLEYREEGMRPKEAMEKAKRILDCFEIE